MADRFVYDVFLSHNAKDKPRVRALAEELRAAGLRVWFDEWIIRPGDDIYLAIERGLEAARTQVLCLSPAALGSDWVTLERNTGLFRDPSNAGRRFIPLLLADCKLPDALRRYKYVDYRRKTKAAFAELLAACRSESGSAPPVREAVAAKNPSRPLKQAGPSVVLERELTEHKHRVKSAARAPLQGFIGIEKIVSETAAAENVENEDVQVDHLVKVARIMKSFIGIAIDLLPSRSYDILVEEYHLVSLGFSMRRPEAPALSKGAHRIALFRARKRFQQILGVVCGATQTALHEESASLRASMADARKLIAFSEAGQPFLLDTMELLRLVKAAKGFIRLAVDLLPDREHDLIIELYGLERLGFSLRNPASLFFSTDQDNKMLHQARAVFMSNFEAVLAATQAALEYDQGVIRRALKLFRGETADIFKVIGELGQAT